MKYFVFIFIIPWNPIFAQNWVNLIPNYSFESVSSNYPINNGTTDGNACPVGPYSAMLNYWAEIPGWTLPLKRLCGKPTSPDVLTYGTNEEPKHGWNLPSRSGIRYGHGTSSEYHVVLTKELLSPNKMYFIECFSGNTGKNIVLSGNPPRQCDNFGFKLKGGPFQVAMSLENYNVNDLGNDYVRTRTYFRPVFEGDWVTIGSESGGGNIDDIRIYEVQENGCRDNWYFDNTVFNYPFEFFQASDKIYVGNGVDPENGVNHIPGDVIVYAGTEVVLQAGNQVIIENVFEMEEGAILTIENKPCNQDLCPEVPSFQDEILCDVPSLQIGAPPNPWGTSVTWSPTTFLDNPTISNPTFTAPSGTGTVNYTVQVTITCDGGFEFTSSHPVTVQYTDNTNPDATVSVLNTDWDVYNYSADFSLGDGVTELTISVNTAPGYQETFYVGTDFTGNIFNWELPDAWRWSSCHDDEIIITARNGCLNVEQTIILDWPKSQIPFQFPTLPNVITPNNDGVNDVLCFNISSADYYSIQVLNRWQNTVYFASGEITNSPFCTWAPEHGYFTDGTYTYLLTINDNCENTQQGHQHIQLVNGNLGMIPNNDFDESQNMNDELNTDENNLEINLQNLAPENHLSRQPSILVYPNPSSGKITVLSEKNNISVVRIFDAKGALVFEQFVESNNVIIETQDLSAGIYMLETQLDNGVDRQKIIIQ